MIHKNIITNLNSLLITNILFKKSITMYDYTIVHHNITQPIQNIEFCEIIKFELIINKPYSINLKQSVLKSFS